MRIAVIGGGIAGLSAAWGALRAGHSVVLFEKDVLGAGASGLALGGLVAFHPNVKGNLARVQRQCVAEWPAFAAGLGEAAGVAVADFFRGWGEGMAQVRIPLIFEVFRAAIAACGGEIRMGAAVTEMGAIRAQCDAVVVAAGWGSAALGLADVRVVAGQAVRVRPKALVARMQYVDGTYVVPGWDGEVMIGSESWDLDAPGDGVPDPLVTARLLAAGQAVEPALVGAEVVEAWVGYRPAMREGVGLLPLVRPLGDGAVAVTALGKLGFCLAPGVSGAVADWCCGAGQRWENQG